MKPILNIITVITAIFATSCIKDDYIKEVNNDFKTNYEVFWKLFDENYCYFGDNYGYTKNIDWQAVRVEMMPLVEKATTEVELFEIMGKSIDYLKDGHVWIDTKFKHRGCNTFYYDENNVRYPENFISGLIESKYLDYPFKTRNGHKYGTITKDGKTFFYLHHAEFVKDLTKEDIEMFQPLIEKSDGIIYDIRTNPGWNSQLAIEVAGRFVKEKTFVGYEVVKFGKGYNDLCEPTPLYIELPVIPFKSGYCRQFCMWDLFCCNDVVVRKLRCVLIPKYMIMDRYVCIICGYVYDPAEGDPENEIPAGTPFEELPEDWVCPACGVGLEHFEKET